MEDASVSSGPDLDLNLGDVPVNGNRNSRTVRCQEGHFNTAQRKMSSTILHNERWIGKIWRIGREKNAPASAEAAGWSRRRRYGDPVAGGRGADRPTAEAVEMIRDVRRCRGGCVSHTIPPHRGGPHLERPECQPLFRASFGSDRITRWKLWSGFSRFVFASRPKGAPPPTPSGSTSNLFETRKQPEEQPSEPMP